MTDQASPTAKAPATASKSPSTSPKGSDAGSPKEGSPRAAATIAGILPAQHWVDTAEVRMRCFPDGNNPPMPTHGTQKCPLGKLTPSALGARGGQHRRRVNREHRHLNRISHRQHPRVPQDSRQDVSQRDRKCKLLVTSLVPNQQHLARIWRTANIWCVPNRSMKR